MLKDTPLTVLIVYYQLTLWMHVGVGQHSVAFILQGIPQSREWLKQCIYFMNPYLLYLLLASCPF